MGLQPRSSGIWEVPSSVVARTLLVCGLYLSFQTILWKDDFCFKGKYWHY